MTWDDGDLRQRFDEACRERSMIWSIASGKLAEEALIAAR
jgi:hypothetical protein